MAPWGRIHKHLFSSKLINGTNKLECLYLESLSSLGQCNTLTYWAYLYVTKNMKCCVIFTNTNFL